MKLTGTRILLVEDDDDLRETLALYFAKLGCVVEEANSGRAAVKVIETRGAIPLVVTDIVMPDTDGIELIRIIRSRYPATRIVAVTGGGLIGAGNYLKLAQQLGADLVLEKPFSFKELGRLLAELPEAEGAT